MRCGGIRKDMLTYPALQPWTPQRPLFVRLNPLNIGTTMFQRRKSRTWLSISRMLDPPLKNLIYNNVITLTSSQFQVLSPSELPEGVKFGVAFTTLTLNAPNHLNYLYERLQKEYGVRFVRKVVSDIRDPFSNPKTKIVFNCVGNQAKTLLGVEDPQCYPTRGQVLLARAPHVHTNVMRHGRGYETYIIPRPESNGCVILGGYMQKGNR